MPGQQLPARIDLRADRLRHAENDAARERAPHAAEAADDDRLEAEDQPGGPDRRVEIGAHGEKNAGDRDDRKRQRHGQREDVAIVETHQLRHGLIVRRRAEGAAERGAIEQELQAGDDGDGDHELQQRQDADPNALAERKARDLDSAGLEPAAVGREQLQQPVLDDDGEAEGHQQRRQDVVAERAVEQAALQPIADRRHERHDDERWRARD